MRVGRDHVSFVSSDTLASTARAWASIPVEPHALTRYARGFQDTDLHLFLQRHPLFRRTRGLICRIWAFHNHHRRQELAERDNDRG
jgi:hypothetical protein